MCSQASNTQSNIIFIHKVKQRFKRTRSLHWFGICYIIIHMSLDWIGICYIIIHMCSQASNVQSNIVLFTKWSNAFDHEVSVDFRFGNSRAKPRFKHAVQVKFFINKVRHPFEHEASIYFLFGSQASRLIAAELSGYSGASCLTFDRTLFVSESVPWKVVSIRGRFDR